MTDQLQAAQADTNTADSEIQAEVSWTVGNRPPEVVLEFQGLHEPTALFDQLRAIGWTVPPMPPRPANAIDWTPDPVAGTDYTVLPWKVQEFKLEPGTWAGPEETVGTRTLDALLDNSAEIIGSSDQITAHAADYAARQAAQADLPIPAAAQPSADTTTQAPTPTDQAADPATAPVEAPAGGANGFPPGASTGTGFRTTIVLGIPASADPLPNAGRWVGITGRKKDECDWNEVTQPANEPVPGYQRILPVINQGATAWFLETDAALPEKAPTGQTMVRMVIPELAVNDAKIRRLSKVLGDSMTTYQLRPLAGGDATAVLLIAVVAANSFEMLRSNLCLRMPTAAVRIPR